MTMTDIEKKIVRKRGEIAQLENKVNAAKALKRTGPEYSPIQYRLTREQQARSAEVSKRRGLTDNEQARDVYVAWLARQP